MRTLQILPALEQGGVERGVVEMNRAIVRRGWTNIVVSSGGRLVSKIESDGGVHITLDVKSKNPLTFFSRARALGRVLDECRADVVCVHSRVPAWLFAYTNRKRRIRWITFAHGANSISRYSAVMTRGDVTVTPSNYIADYLVDAYGLSRQKIRVIPRAVNRDLFDPKGLDRDFMLEKKRQWGIDGAFTVMGVGRITQLKGYDILIRAMALLGKDCRLVIVGEAERSRKGVEESLRRLAVELGIDDRVVFAGNQAKVAECMALSDVVVSANVTKPEAFGRSMAEALAVGRPVVARAFGGALDIVRDGVDGVLVDGDGDWPEKFADAIRKVRSIDFSPDELSRSAFERFSFEKMVDSSLHVYSELSKG